MMTDRGGRRLGAWLLAAALGVPSGCGGGGGSGGNSGVGNSGGGTGGGGGTSPQYTAQFREFAVPVGGTVPGDPHPGCWPDDLAIDDQGDLWFGEHHADEIGRFTPQGSGYVYQGYPVPTKNSVMDSVALDQARHRVWVSENDGNRLALLDTGVTPPTVTEFPVSTATDPDPVPGDLALDAAGRPWFTSPYETQGRSAPASLGELDPATGQVTYYPTPGSTTGLDGIVFDRTGAIWFADLGASRIGRYAQGQFTEYPTSPPQASPFNPAIDAAGKVWVTEAGTNAVAVFDPADTTGQPWRLVPIPTPQSNPAGIAIDAAGNVWFTESATSKIGLIPAGTTTAVDFAIPTPDCYPEDIQVAPDGVRVFFTERYGNKVAQITVTP